MVSTMYDFAGLLFVMLAAHVVCDWPLQPPAMSIAKRPGSGDMDWRLALGAHSLIHGGAVALVTGYWPLGVAEMLSHAAIDAAKCRNKIGMAVDQALHLGCKLVWAMVAADMAHGFVWQEIVADAALSTLSAICFTVSVWVFQKLRS